MSCPLLFWAPFQITNREFDVPGYLALKIYEQLQSPVTRGTGFVIHNVSCSESTELSGKHQPDTVHSHHRSAKEAGG